MNAIVNLADHLPTKGPMSPALAIMLNDALFERAKLIAKYMSESDGFVPPHLLGKPQACFAVVTRAMTWKLDPYAVAQSTYQTPGGRVGYEGKLYQAILENSGLVKGGVTFEHYGTVTVKLPNGRVAKFKSTDPALAEALDAGAVEQDRKDWSAVQGKFEIKRSDKGKDYAVPTWKRPDAEGLGVFVRATVAGEDKPRELDFELIQAFPLNSTLWATDPKTQICYTAVRRFASVRVPGIFIGLPVERDDDPAEMAIDVTPARPTRDDYRGGAAASTTTTFEDVDRTPTPYEFIDEHGESHEYKRGNDALAQLNFKLERHGAVIWEYNGALIARLREEDMIEGVGETLDIWEQRFAAQPAQQQGGGTGAAAAADEAIPEAPADEEDDFPGTKPSGSAAKVAAQSAGAAPAGQSGGDQDGDEFDRAYDALLAKLKACKSRADVDAFPAQHRTEIQRIATARKDLGADWSRQLQAAVKRFPEASASAAKPAGVGGNGPSTGGQGNLV